MIFVIVEGFIISGFSEKGQPGADYVIVLGAQMKASGKGFYEVTMKDGEVIDFRYSSLD